MRLHPHIEDQPWALPAPDPAGGVYYFEIKNTYWLDHGSPGLNLSLLDSDQGQLLVNTYALSIFHRKCIERKDSPCPQDEESTMKVSPSGA